ncbi:MAG: UvrD-helicase domain-containing protein [Clostridia bacterium]|nr:UvrD-helicase domain-containing protein [Clostridia bacterium]
MARKWTPSQEVAMTLRDKTLLVSAAAGSGKTSVLTERIIRSLIDPDHPADLSRMLIVTFTRAAASELKGRIASALSDAMAKNPGNKHLSRQLFLLGSAQISTIDSFFQKAVRANFEQLSLPASFRLADEGELLPLRMEILEGLIEEFYQAYDAPPADDSPFGALRANRFAYAMDHLMSDRSDGKLEAFLLDFPQIYAAEPDGVDALRRCAEELRANVDANFLETPHGAAIRKHLTEQYTSLVQYLEDLREYVAPSPDLKGAIDGTILSDLGYCQAVLDALNEGSYERLRVVVPTFQKGKFPSLKELKTDRMEAYQDFRNKRLKDAVADASAYVSPTIEQIRDSMLASADLIEVLHVFFKEFDRRLLSEKNERGVLEYDDVRAMLYKLLANPDGTPTPFADSLAAQYDAVYIDEYQDVDLLQDRIFALIGRNRRFMVGDIKQSIYGFRGSEPSIFAGYRKAMPLYSDPAAADSDGCCVFMSENFRCDEPVIRFANRVCSFLFSACDESVGYTENDDLRFSKEMPANLPEGLPAPVQVAVFDSTLAQKKAADPDAPHAPDEPVWVAAEISRLLREGVLDNGHRILPSDIAILVRKNKHGTAFAEELKKLNIPVTTATASNIMETPLLSDLLNLLRAIDNPYRDLPLSEFLLSGLGGFTLEELSAIRDASERSTALYDATVHACGDAELDAPLREKAREAVTFFEEQRLHVATLPADRFLRLLYQSEWLCDYADTPAALFLYEQARAAQRAAFCGLYEFLGSFTKLLENGKVSTKGFTKPESAVTVMTVHNSKGLEFPVVFCVATASTSQNYELDDPILFHRTLGGAAKHYNRETEVLEETPLRLAARLTLEAEANEESIRTLYVALTRARERLYVTGTLGGLWSTAQATAAQIKRHDRATILGTANNLTWVMAALAEPSAPDEPTPWTLTHYETGTVEAGVPLAAQADDADDVPVLDTNALHYAEILSRQEHFEYPMKHLQGLPTKIAASKISTDLLDTLTESEEDEEESLLARIELMRAAPPAFDALMGSGNRPSATDIGTATHAFLEFCDYSALQRNGIDAECARLCAEGFLSPESVAIINRGQLEAFVASDLMGWIKEATRVRREQTFALFLPAKNLTKRAELAEELGEQTVFVQGSIDLLLEMPDGTLRLIDYKTDRILPEEREDLAALSARMLSAHGDQLAAYARAVNNLFGRYPDDIRIYSLPLGATVPLQVDEILKKA